MSGRTVHLATGGRGGLVSRRALGPRGVRRDICAFEEQEPEAVYGSRMELLNPLGRGVG